MCNTVQFTSCLFVGLQSTEDKYNNHNTELKNNYNNFLIFKTINFLNDLCLIYTIKTTVYDGVQYDVY